MKDKILCMVKNGHGLDEIMAKLHCPRTFLLSALTDAVGRQEISPGRLRLLEDGIHCLNTVMVIMDSGGLVEDVAKTMEVTPKTARKFIVEAMASGWVPRAPLFKKEGRKKNGNS